jgi:hypothetical protein
VAEANPDDWTRTRDVTVEVPTFWIDRRPAAESEFRDLDRASSAATVPPGPKAARVALVEFPRAEALLRWQGKRLPSEAEFEVAVRGRSGRWPDRRVRAEYDYVRQLSYNDPASFHPDDVSPWGIPGLLKHERLWMRERYVEGPFFLPGTVDGADLATWRDQNDDLRLQRGQFPAMYPSFPGTGTTAKHSDPLQRVRMTADSVGFVRGVSEFRAP